MIESHFKSNFAEHGELGASLSVWRGAEEVVSLHGGFADRAKTRLWTADTLVTTWSCTKGVSAACVLLALHEAGRDLTEPVATIWPALPGPTFEQLLSHQAGLAVLDQWSKIDDHASVVAAIESQAVSPNWVHGEAHGYHTRTFGFIVDELIRRLTGAENLGEFWRERVAEPLGGLDFWIGLPESEDHRVAELPPRRARIGGGDSEFYKAFEDKESLTRRAFSSPRGLHAVADMNEAKTRRMCLPAMGGIGSARALARFYAEFATGSERIFPRPVHDQAQQLLVSGPDRILLTDTAFAAGFMKDPIDGAGRKQTQLFGPSLKAFGHPGAGGSLAFADPENGIAFAYVMNQMELSLLPTEKALGLVRAVYEGFSGSGVQCSGSAFSCPNQTPELLNP